MRDPRKRGKGTTHTGTVEGKQGRETTEKGRERGGQTMRRREPPTRDGTFLRGKFSSSSWATLTSQPPLGAPVTRRTPFSSTLSWAQLHHLDDIISDTFAPTLIFNQALQDVQVCLSASGPTPSSNFGLSASTPASCVEHGGAVLSGAFLSSSCGPSYSGDVLLLLFADDMRQAKISLNLSMYFICASSVCK